jgi:CRISPR-associated endonuclease/helicase Cas3
MDGWILQEIQFKKLNMSNYNHILAKSNPKVPLKEHLLSVKNYAKLAAIYFGLDENIAVLGALLHDIGKTSPLFQRKLNQYPNKESCLFFYCRC